MNVKEMQGKHRLLAEYKYQLGTIDKGYTNRTLYINVGDNAIKEKPVTNFMKEKFTGGKGFGLWYLWNAVTPETKWDDPENEIVVGTGPICGITQYPGSGKSLVVSLSPLTGLPFDSNVGGFFGPYLKFSGFDALEIQGKAEKDVIVITDGSQGGILSSGHAVNIIIYDNRCNINISPAGMNQVVATDGRGISVTHENKNIKSRLGQFYTCSKG
jgi:aldehyde:ferredoxin oxidoreductase